MKERRRYVISYDIVEDKRRIRVAHALEGHGERVQYSVFECLLTDAQFDRLWQELGVCTICQATYATWRV